MSHREDAPAAFTVLVTVDAEAANTPPPPRYGVFYEDYNHGGDGGLYAELVKNAGFATGGDCWTLTGGSGQAASDPDGYGCLYVRSPGPETTLANSGFWGMRVQAGAQYRLTARADGSRFAGTVEAHLRDASSATIASAPLDLSAGDGASVTLTPRCDGNNAHLVLIFCGMGEIVFSHVSLLPTQTWRGLPLRADLADAIAALRPAFVRFPGGCNLAGVTPERCIRWKDSLGPVHRRRGVHQIWEYHITEGLGFHELLLWCEALGAEPWLTVNCGMMAHWRTDCAVPLDELDPWVQDALDAIEYCNGEPSTRWGSERARRGHPEPFGLRCIEIGNEHSGPKYDARFARFYDAIKARHPDVAVVANFPVAGRTPDVVDEHFYGCPQRLIAQTARFARYDRTGPPIAVTEYGVTTEATWRGALAEAVFLIGAESNADRVQNVCHGALWRNLNDPLPCWPINTLHFDAQQVFPQPTYFVQQAFNQHRGAAVLPTCVQTDPPGSGRANLGTWQPPRTGRVGLGTTNAEAQFCDLVVTASDGRVLAHVPGPVKPEDGERADLHRMGTVGLWGDPNAGDYTVRVRARKTGGAEGFQIYVRVRDERNFLMFRAGIWNNTRHSVDGCVGGRTDTLDLEAPFALEVGRWYDVAVRVHGDDACLTVTLDDQMLWDYALPPPPAVCTTTSRTDGGEIIVKAVNLCDAPASAQIQLAGVTGALSGSLYHYRAELDACNDPQSVPETALAPVVSRHPIPVFDGGDPLCLTLPPYSLTIARLHAMKE